VGVTRKSVTKCALCVFLVLIIAVSMFFLVRVVSSQGSEPDLIVSTLNYFTARFQNNNSPEGTPPTTTITQGETESTANITLQLLLNTGENASSTLSEINATLEGLPSGFEIIPSKTINAGNLSPGEGESITWLVRALSDAPLGEQLLNASINAIISIMGYDNNNNNTNSSSFPQYFLLQSVSDNSFKLIVKPVSLIPSILLPEENRKKEATAGSPFDISSVLTTDSWNPLEFPVWLNWSLPDSFRIISGSSEIPCENLSASNPCQNNITIVPQEAGEYGVSASAATSGQNASDEAAVTVFSASPLLTASFLQDHLGPVEIVQNGNETTVLMQITAGVNTSLSNINATLEGVPPGVEVIVPGPAQAQGLEPGESTLVSWTFRATGESVAGEYQLDAVIDAVGSMVEDGTTVPVLIRAQAVSTLPLIIISQAEAICTGGEQPPSIPNVQITIVNPPADNTTATEAFRNEPLNLVAIVTTDSELPLQVLLRVSWSLPESFTTITESEETSFICIGLSAETPYTSEITAVPQEEGEYVVSASVTFEGYNVSDSRAITILDTNQTSQLTTKGMKGPMQQYGQKKGGGGTQPSWPVSYNSTQANVTVNGTGVNAYLGNPVASGDVNGDGYKDLIVSSYGASANGIAGAGQVYVFFGSPTANLDGKNWNATSAANVTINGTAATNWVGSSVASGDVNHDGYDDLIIGAYYASPYNGGVKTTNAGQVYVFFGGAAATLDGASWNATSANVTVNGTYAGDYFGYSVASGDVNNDSYGDFIISAVTADPFIDGVNQTNAGRAYVFFGGATATLDGKNWDASSANVTLNGTYAGDAFGRFVASGDLNGDGYKDVITGAYIADPFIGGVNQSNAGQAYVFFGGNFTTQQSWSTASANITVNGTNTTDWLGNQIASGDLNGDGFGDLITGAYYASPNGVSKAGQAYVFFGGNFTTQQSWSTASANITVNGTNASDYLGQTVASGDVNGDGYSDLIIGASFACPNGQVRAGQAYVFLGGPTANLNGGNWNSTSANVTLNGTATMDFLSTQIASGDLNNDGYSELIAGAWGADPVGKSMAGQAYVFFIMTDTTPPVMTVQSPLNQSYATTSIWANVTLDERGRCNYSLDGAANVSMDNSTGNHNSLMTVSAEGLHNVTFYCNDTTGNMNSTTSYFTADLTLPTITIQSPLNQTYNTASIWANVTLDEAGACNRSLDGSANVTLSNSTGNHNDLMTVSGEGLHYVIFFCNDTAGNNNYTTQYFSVDTVLPTIAIQSPSNQTYNTSSVWANVTLTENGSCYSSLDGGTNVSLSNTTGNFNSLMGYVLQQNFDEQVNGEYPTGWYNIQSPGYIKVYSTKYFSSPNGLRHQGYSGVSIEGRNFSSALSRDFTIEFNLQIKLPNATTPWNLTFDNQTSGGWNDAGTSMRMTNNDTFLWFGNGSNFVALQSFSADVWYHINIMVDWSEKTADVYIDGVLKGSNLAFYQNTVSSVARLYVQAPNVATRNVFYDDFQVYSVGDGLHNVTFYCNDTTGNMNSTTSYFTVDLTLPTITVQSPLNQTYGGSVWANVTLDEAGSCNRSLDGGENVTLSNSTGNHNDLMTVSGDGLHNVTFYCNDTTGNVNSTMSYFSVDLTLPTIMVQSPSNQTYTTSSVWANVTLDEEGSCNASLDDGANFTLSNSTGNFNSLMSIVNPYGPHFIRFFCTDTNGNLNSTTMYFNDSVHFPISYDARSSANLTINGTVAGDQLGRSMGSGDVNGDGYTDWIIGASAADPNGQLTAGAVFVFFGGPTANLNGKNWDARYANVTLNGTGAGDAFGRAIASGDLNNDGYDDLIISATGANTSGIARTGQVYVFFGGPNIDGKNWNATSANLTLNGTAASDALGWAVASGDLNNDGYDDLISGGYQASPNGISKAGQAYVFFGNSTSALDGKSWSASSANVTINGTTVNEYLSSSVASGDVNNDGYDDLIIGAYGANSYAGQAYVFFGGATATLDGASWNSTSANVTLNGTEGRLGMWVVSGDVNGDGYSDVITGAYMASPYVGGVKKDYAGQAYVFFGNSTSALDGASWNSTSANITINGTTANEYCGYYTASTDVNGDGYDDVMTSAYMATTNGQDRAGQVYVFLGNSTSVIDGANWVSASAKVTINGTLAGDYLGQIFTSGDVNGDGYGDLLIGAFGADPFVGGVNQSSAGQVYVPFIMTDTTPSVITLQSPLNQTYGGSVWANVTLNERGRCNYSIDGAANVSMDNSTGNHNSLMTVSAEGLHNVTFYCNDTTGNMNSTASYFTVDLTLPTITIQSPLNQTYGGSVWANVTLDEEGSCNRSLDGSANVTLSNSTGNHNDLMTVSGEGLHYVIFFCNDTAGNNNYTTQYFSVDTVLPTITIQSPSNTTYDTASVWANVTLSEDGSCNRSLDGGENVSMSNTARNFYDLMTVSEEGLHNVTFFCNDTFGNASSIVSYFSVDFTLPTITVQSPLNQTYDTSDIWANATLDEAGSCDKSLDGGINTSLSNTSGNFNMPISYIQYLHQDFDEQTPGDDPTGWYNVPYSGEGSNNVSGEDYVSDPNSMKQHCTTASRIDARNFTNALSGDFVVEFDWQATAKTAGFILFDDYTSGEYSANYATSLDFVVTGGKRKLLHLNLENYGYIVDPVSIGTWYHLKLVFKWDTKTLDAYVDDELVAENVAFVGNPDAIRRIYSELDETGTWYYDNLEVHASKNELLWDGLHNVTFYCNDTSENQNSTIQYFTVEVPPVITVQSPLNQTYDTPSVWANVTLDEDGFCNASLDAGANFTLSNSTGNFNSLMSIVNPYGSHSLQFFCTDIAGNPNSTTMYFNESIHFPMSSSASSASITVNGTNAGDGLSYQIASGDVNGDGYDDLIIGAYGADPNGQSAAGQVYVFFGSTTSDLDGKNWDASSANVTLNGTAAGDYLGMSVSSGDVNGDGFGDLIVGAYGADSGAGQAYVFFGGPTVELDGKNWDASSANVKLTGTNGYDYFGYSVSSGDVNGDGYSDLIIGAYGPGSDAGQAYVFFGNTTADLEDEGWWDASSANVIITGTTAGDRLGESVSSGDVNGDGYSDLIIGSEYASSSAGQAYVFFGGATATLDGASWDAASANVTVNGTTAGDELGWPVASGDVNGDGFSDLIIGAEGANSNAGQAYVFFGNSTSALDGKNWDAASANVTLNGTTAGDYFGYSISSGDVNGDSYDDLIIGTWAPDSNAGQAYVFLGSTTSDLDGKNWDASSANVTLNGTASGDWFGDWVSSGDVNGDGFSDLIICADGASPNGLSGAGQAYVFFIMTDTTPPAITVQSPLNQTYDTSDIWANATLDEAGSCDKSLDGGTNTSLSNTSGNFNRPISYIQYLQQDFDEQTPGDDPTGWYNVPYSGEGSNNVSGEDYVSDPNSMKQHCTTASRIDARNFTNALSGDFVVEFDWQATAKTAGFILFDDYTSGEYSANYATSLDFERLGKHGARLALYLENYDYIMDPVSPDTWYHLKLVFKWDAKTLDAYVDDELVAENVAFVGNPDAIRRIYSEIDNIGTWYYDNLEVHASKNELLWDGLHNVTFYCSDTAGNQNSTIQYFSVEIPPVITVQSPLNQSYTTASIWANVTLDQEGSCDLSVNDTDNVSMSNTTGNFNYYLSELPDGPYNVTFFCNDTSGNRNSTTQYFFVDTILPTITVQSPLNQTYDTPSVWANATLDEDGYCDASLDVGANFTLSNSSGNFNYLMSIMNPYGSHSLQFFCTDIAGNKNSTIVYFNESILFPLSYSAAVSANLTVNGTVENDYLGYAIAYGDVNGDYYDDLILGAYAVDPNGQTDAGQAYVFFGGPIANLDGKSWNAAYANITINGTIAGDNLGIIVASGDLNGDGFSDLIIGAYAASPNGQTNAGQAYVFFGGPNLDGKSWDASSANVTLNGTTAGDLFGAYAGSGDLNGDNYDDLILGGWAPDPNGITDAGQAYVFFGGPNLDGKSWDASSANVTINGTNAGDLLGTWFASGDVNGDGFSDLIIGAYGAGSYAGQAYVFFGSSNLDGASWDSTYANITINGTAAGDALGQYLESGDLNGDGYDDLLISAYGADPNGQTSAGQTYVFFGGPNLDGKSWDAASSANVTINGTNAGDDLGDYVAAGDVNGDGYDDLLIGTWGADPNGLANAGQAYVFLGGETAALDGKSWDAAYANITVNGTAADDWLSWPVVAGDMNGDGFDDLGIGAYAADPNGISAAGQAYVFFIMKDTTPPTITVQSPLNQSYDTLSVWANATLNETGRCNYSLDGAANVSMSNSTGNHNSLMTVSSDGLHNVTFWCNDTTGNLNSTVQYFSVNTVPVVREIRITTDPLAPGTMQVVNVMITDVSGFPGVNATNCTCWSADSSEGASDGWDHWTNSTGNWTLHNATAVNYTFFRTADNHAENGTWTCKIYANDTVGDKDTNQTTFTMSTRAGILLGSSSCTVNGDPGDTNKTITDCFPDTITHDGNVNISLGISSSDLTGQSDASWVILVGNLTHYGTSDAGSSIQLTTSTYTFNTLFTRGTPSTANTTNRYMWLNFPLPLKPQDYQGTVTISVT